MIPSSAPRGRARWIGLVALALLLAGIAVGVRQWRRPEVARRGAAPVADDAAPAPVDSAEIKARWVEDVRGMELAGLSAPRRELFVRYANAERCTCGCGYTLAGCRASDMTCEVSGPRLDALLDSVRTGRITSASGLRQRPHDGG